jgi:MFS family permease
MDRSFSRVSNLAKYYTWSCISGFNLVFIIQAIYLLDRGFSVTQLALFASMTALCSTLLEIPTGYIADKFSRKVSLALGFLCVSIAYIGLAFVQTMPGLFLVSVCLGLNNALESGAAEALLFDELKRFAKDSDYLRIISRGSMFAQIAAAAASLIGPILYAADPIIPFIINSAINLFLTFFVLTFNETTASHEVSRAIHVFDGVRKVFRVKPLLIITCIDMFLLVFANIFYQVLYFPKLNQLGLSVQYLGFVDVATLACMTVMLLYLPKMVFRADRVNLVLYTLAPAGIFIVFGMTTHLLVAIVFGPLFDLAWMARKYIIGALTNTYLTAHDRALSLSSISFLSNAVAALLVPLAMYMFSLSYAFSFIPALIIIALLILFATTQLPARSPA